MSPVNTAPDQLFGRTVIDAQGEKVGKVDGVLVDSATGLPEWVGVSTGLFGSRQSLVPIAQATDAGDELHVPVSKSQVKDAPNIDGDHELSQQEEQQLYSHYGMPYGESQSPSGLPEGGAAQGTVTDTGAAQTGHDTSGPTTDNAMTRSEEQLRVGTQTVESGRARLRKYVVTEQVQQTVPVTHEEVRVEREPVTDANIGAAMDGPDISEEEHEVVLHEERPVVAKEAVPVERVRLSTEQVAGEARVDEELRKEQIETGGVEAR